jgi:hypothetical protein
MVNEHYGSGGSAHLLDWTNDQHLSGGWISARTPVHFLVRKCESRRERVTVDRNADGRIHIVNGLGAEIKKLLYADETGAVFTASRVAEGAQAVLEPASQSASSRDLRDLYTQDWLTKMEAATKAPHTLLRPRSYVAILDASPFVEDGLANAKYRQTRAIVIGTPKEGGDAN